MHPSSSAVHRAALIAETDALADLLRAAGPATPIPTCPGWTLADLVTHIGRAQRWAATMITERATEELDTRAVAGGARPKEPEAAAQWLSATLLLALMGLTGPAGRKSRSTASQVCSVTGSSAHPSEEDSIPTGTIRLA